MGFDNKNERLYIVFVEEIGRFYDIVLLSEFVVFFFFCVKF